jgi:putative endonuclease
MSVQNNRTVGAEHEKIAGEYLAHQGYEILDYNFHSRTGEIDIIARDGEYLVFVEVKYRKSTASGHPLEAVTATKQKAISKTALFYMKKHGLEYMPVRFDVVGMVDEQVTLIKNAFDFVL